MADSAAPKLLFLVTEDWYFVSHRLPLALAARRQGYDVAVVTRCRNHCRMITDAKLKVIPFEMDRRGLNPFVLLREVLALVRIYRRERPDVVHHVALRAAVVGAMAARIAGIRRVVSAVTGMGFLFAKTGRRPVTRRLVELSLPSLLGRGLTITQNAADTEQLAEFGLAKSSLRLIPGAGVDTTCFSPLHEPAGPPVVMMISRLLWDKGVGEFVEAARQLYGLGARFVLVGGLDPGNPASVTEEDVQGWTAEGFIECWGYCEDMVDTISKAHLVCLPSYREGLSKALLEAMACGKPCVTSDVPGCRDVVRHGDNGLLVPAQNAGALAKAIKQLLDDPEARLRMGARGRERAVAEFSQDRVISATLKVYGELWS